MTTTPRKVVLFGNGQMASVAHTTLTHDSPYEVVAFTADDAHITDRTHDGLPVVPFECVQRFYPPDEFGMHISISFRRVNQLRAEKYEAAKAKGYHLVNYVSSRAVTWPGLVIGDNCWVMDHAVLQPHVTVGSDVYIGPASHVGHHSVVGDHCFLAGHVAVAGFTRIEPYCFLGMGSIVRDGLTVARESVVGAGGVILRNTRPQGVYVAQPATLLPTPSSALSDDFR